MTPVKKEKAIESIYAGCLDFASGAFARAVERLAGECWRPSGLPPGQAILLLHVFNEYDAFPQFISAELQVNPSVITRLTDKLVAKGLVYRMTGGNWVSLSPTLKAQALLSVLMECSKDFEDRCAELLGRDQVRSLAASLNQATDKITDHLSAKNVAGQTKNPPGNDDLRASKHQSGMATAESERRVDLSYLGKSLPYESYEGLVEDLVEAGKSTGPRQSQDLLHYSKLNVQRMHRVGKTMQVIPEIRTLIQQITGPQTWLVLSEGWCGDAAQSMPVMQALAKLNPLISVRVLLRDDNLELMDRYLTNGVSRSIPKLIAVDPYTGIQLFTWGPRPTALQASFYGMQSEGLLYDVIKEELQHWYNKDKTVTIQQELAALATAAGASSATSQP